jgi:hypothetical protein
MQSSRFESRNLSKILKKSKRVANTILPAKKLLNKYIPKGLLTAHLKYALAKVHMILMKSFHNVHLQRMHKESMHMCMNLHVEDAQCTCVCVL